MRRTWIGIGAVAALVAAAPGAASGSTHQTVRAAVFDLPASNGYDAYLFAIHQLHPRRHATLSLALEKKGSYAAYTAHALFTKRHLKASLGAFGRINLRVRPYRGVITQGKMRSPEPARADQAKAKRERACLIDISGSHESVGRGRVRFQGDQGYSSIHVNRAIGTDGIGKESCSSRGKHARGTFLTAKAGQLQFSASQYHRSRHPDLVASERQTVGKVQVALGAFNYRGGVFDFSPDFMTAHVEPSEGPLTGSADFAAPNQWTGDLTASFPGEPDVPLTGPDFTARLKHR